MTPDGDSLYALVDRSGAPASYSVLQFDIGPSGISAKSPASVAASTTPFDIVVTPSLASVAAFGLTANAAGTPTFFDARGSAGKIARYDWDFGDGTTLANGGPTPSHIYAAPGNYTVRLTVTPSTHTVYTGTTPLIDGNPTSTAHAFSVGATTPEPIFEETVVAEPVSGTVLIRLPGSSTYVPLESVTSIPEGSTIDARHGRVRIISSKSPSGGDQSAVFYGGIFTVTYEPGQAYESRKKKRKRRSPVTQVKLRGKVGPCPRVKRKHARKSAHDARRRRRRRHLWGHGKGRFRTRGRRASATVRGTWWLVEDRCDGTLTKVRRGKVRVRDFRRHKTILVKAHHSYLARARGR